MGAVYRGKQKALDRTVAIKILPPEVDDEDASYTERFKNEAKIMAKLEHPAIVPVYDFGETSEGQLYFVMSFINGTDVHQMVQSQGRLPPEHALAITAHVCDALRYAHEHGVIHRDIKPSNVLINMEGQVKVADFGLAKADDPSQSSGLTKTGLAMGTPDYVAPETLTLGMTVDGRADLYAVGVMLYQMLTGNVPRGAFKPASMMIPGLDPRFDAIVTKAMQTDRDDRYPTAADLRRDLDVILTTPLVQAGGQSSAAIPQQSLPPKPQARGPTKPQQRPAQSAPPAETQSKISNPKSKIFMGLGAVAAIAVGAFVMMGGTKDAKQSGPLTSLSATSGVSAPPSAQGTERTTSSTPIKVREEPKPAPAPISNPKSTISGPSAQQFPPGKWVKVFTKAEDLPAELRKPDSGVKFEDGWILTSRSSAIQFTLADATFQNVGVRARIRRINTGSGILGVRRSTSAYYQLKCSANSDQKPRCALEVRNLANANLGHNTVLSEKSVSPGPDGECVLELGVVGDRVSYRFDDKLFDVVADKTVTNGRLTYYGNYPVRDIEVINLDGIPEAEALKILGVDEKGSDLRAALAGTQSGAALQRAQTPPTPNASPSASTTFTPTAQPSGDGLKPGTALFPPGQWVDITDEYLQANPSLKREADGWIKLIKGEKKKPGWKFSACAFRLIRRWESSSPQNNAQISLNGSGGQFNLTLDNDKGFTVFKQTGSNVYLIPRQALPEKEYAGEVKLELVYLGQQIIGRVNDHLSMAKLSPEQVEKTVTPHTYFAGSGSSIRDIEVMSLDGLSEAEARRILGVDEKGNDLRALAAKQEQQKAEQAKVVDAMAAIPELKTLHEQFVKLQAERVTAPFEADVAKLNASYLGGLDREIAKERAKGALDGVIALEAEKKLVASTGSRSRVAGPSANGTAQDPAQSGDARLRVPLEATANPLPTEDDDTTPAVLKPLRKLYRDAFAKLETTRTANLKQLTDPLSIRLKQLESTLTQQNRIPDAKVVREYREGLGRAVAPEDTADQSPSTNPAAAALTAATTPQAPKYSEREVAEWFLGIGASLLIKTGANPIKLESGDKVPAGAIKILEITGTDRQPSWTFTDDDFARLRGLKDLRRLWFGTCDAVDGHGLSLMGKLPALTQLKLSFPRFVSSNLATVPDFPALKELQLPFLNSPKDFGKLPPLKSLISLTQTAGSSNVTRELLAAYAKRTKLESLNMSNCDLKDDNLAELAPLTHLERIEIGNTAITGTGLRHLAGLPALAYLSVGASSFEVRNLALIAELKKVRTLVLRAATFAKAPDECLSILASLKNQISDLSITYTTGVVTDEQIAAIRKAMPKTKVTVGK